MEGLRSDQGRAEDPFRMELAEAGPLGKPIHGKTKANLPFCFQGSLKRSSSPFYLTGII